MVDHPLRAIAESYLQAIVMWSRGPDVDPQSDMDGLHTGAEPACTGRPDCAISNAHLEIARQRLEDEGMPGQLIDARRANVAARIEQRTNGPKLWRVKAPSQPVNSCSARDDFDVGANLVQESR